jgi:hypothetical protein
MKLHCNYVKHQAKRDNYTNWQILFVRNYNTLCRHVISVSLVVEFIWTRATNCVKIYVFIRINNSFKVIFTDFW